LTIAIDAYPALRGAIDLSAERRLGISMLQLQLARKVVGVKLKFSARRQCLRCGHSGADTRDRSIECRDEYFCHAHAFRH